MDAISLFVEHPLLGLIPAMLFASAAFVCRSAVVWSAAGAWALYALYELAMHSRILCSGDCDIRIDLIFIAPLLGGITVVALAYVVARACRSFSAVK